MRINLILKIKILYKNHINKPNEFKGDYEIIRKMKDEFKDIIFYSIIKEFQIQTFKPRRVCLFL